MQLKPEEIEKEILQYLAMAKGKPITDSDIAHYIGAPQYIINRILFDIRQAEISLIEACMDDKKVACHRFIGDIASESAMAQQPINKHQPDSIHNLAADLDDNLSLIKENAPISKGKLQKLMNVSQSQCAKIINLLLDKKMIEIVQKGRSKLITAAPNTIDLSLSEDNPMTSSDIDTLIIQTIANEKLTQTECVERLAASSHIKRLEIIRHLLDMETRGLIIVTEDSDDILLALSDSGQQILNSQKTTATSESILNNIANLEQWQTDISSKISTILTSADLQPSSDAAQDLDKIASHLEQLKNENARFQSLITSIKSLL